MDLNVRNGASTSNLQDQRGNRSSSIDKGSTATTTNKSLVSLQPPLSAISQEASPLDPFFGPNSTVDDSTQDDQPNSSHRPSSDTFISHESHSNKVERSIASDDVPQNDQVQKDRPFILSPPSPETQRKPMPSSSRHSSEEDQDDEERGPNPNPLISNSKSASDLRKKRSLSPTSASLSTSTSNPDFNQRRLSPASLHSESSGGTRTMDATPHPWEEGGGVPLHHSSAPLLSPALGGRSPEGPREAIPQDVEESDGEFSMSGSNRGDDSENESSFRRPSEDGTSSSINRESEDDEDQDEDAFRVANVGLGLESANTFNNGNFSVIGQDSTADRFSSSDMLFSPPPSTTTPQYAIRKSTRDRQPLNLSQPPSKENRNSPLQNLPETNSEEVDQIVGIPEQSSEPIRRVKSVKMNSFQHSKNGSFSKSRPISQPQSQNTRASRSSSTTTSNSSSSQNNNNNQTVPYDPRSPADVPVTPFSEGAHSPKFEPGSDTPAVPRIPGGLILSPGSALLTGGTNASTGQIRGSGLFGMMQNSINSQPGSQRTSKTSRKSELESDQVREEEDEDKRAITPPPPVPNLPESSNPPDSASASSDLLSPQQNGNGSSSAGGSSGYRTVTPGGMMDASSSSSPPSSRGKDPSSSSGLHFFRSPSPKDFNNNRDLISTSKDSEISSDFESGTDNELSPNGSSHSFSSNGSQQTHGLNLRARRLRSRIERLEAAGKEVPSELNESLKEIDTTLKIQRKGQTLKVASKDTSQKEKREIVKDDVNDKPSTSNALEKPKASETTNQSSSLHINDANPQRGVEEEKREEVNDGNEIRNGPAPPVGLRSRRNDATDRSLNHGSSNSSGFYHRGPGSSSSSIRSAISNSDLAGGASRQKHSNARPSLDSIGLGPNSRGAQSGNIDPSDAVSPSAKIAAAWRRPTNESAKASGLTQAQAQVQVRAQNQSQSQQTYSHSHSQSNADSIRSRDTSFEEPRRAPIPPRANPSSSRPGTGNSVSSFGKTPGWGAAALANQAQGRPATAGSTTSAVLPSATTRTLASASVDPRAPWPEHPPPQAPPPLPPAGVEPHRPSTSSSSSQFQPQGQMVKVGTPTQLGRFSFEEKLDLFGNGSQRSSLSPPSVPAKDRRPASASHVESASGWPGGIPSLSIGGLGAGLGLSLEEEEKSQKEEKAAAAAAAAALDQRGLHGTPPRKFGSLPSKNIGSAHSPISRGTGGVGGAAGFGATGSIGRGRALANSMAQSRATQSVDDLVGDKNRLNSNFGPGDSIYASRSSSTNRMSADQPRLASSSSSLSNYTSSQKPFVVSPSSSSIGAGSNPNVTVAPPFLPGAFARDRDRDGSRERSGSVSSQSRHNVQRSDLPYSKPHVHESVEDLQDGNMAGRVNRRRSAGIPAINSNLSAGSHGQQSHSNLSASGHSNLSASGHGHGHSREGSFDSNSGENGPTSPVNRERFLSLSSARTGSSSNLHASPASGSNGHWGGYRHSNHSANSAVSSLHMQAGVPSVDQSRSPQNHSRQGTTNSLSARNEAPRRPSIGGSDVITRTSSRNGSIPNNAMAPRSPSASSYVGSGIITNNHSRPTTPSSQNAAYGRTLPGLKEEDIEYEEIRENPEPSSLYGIRRRLVSTFSNLGSKHSGSSRPLSALRGPGGASRTSLDQNGENDEEWDQGKRGQVLMDEKAMRKAEEKLEQREKNLTIEALSKQEVATVTISVYTEQREGKWVTRGPATRNGELCLLSLRNPLARESKD